jgi:hypothetical protein
MSASPVAIALIWSVSPPRGARARFAAMPLAHASVFSGPSAASSEPVSDWL